MFYLDDLSTLNEVDMSTNVRGGNLIWARMSGVVIWCEHECPGGHLMWARMSGPVKNRVGTNVRGNECPGFTCVTARGGLGTRLSETPPTPDWRTTWIGFTSWAPPRPRAGRPWKKTRSAALSPVGVCFLSMRGIGGTKKQTSNYDQCTSWAKGKRYDNNSNIKRCFRSTI